MTGNQPVDPFAGMTISADETRVLRKQLEMLAQSAKDPRIKEMASNVLAGKTDLRAAILGGRYEDVLNEAVSSFSSWYRNLSDEERAEQERRAQQYVEQLRQEVERPKPARRPAQEDDWEPPASILRKDRPRR